MAAFFRSLAVSLALSAMLVRGILPAGWMPNVAGASDSPFVICSLDGSHHAPAHDPANGQQDEHNLPCPFAAAAHLAPPQVVPTLAVPVETALVSSPVVADKDTAGAGDTSHAPRGPPASV